MMQTVARIAALLALVSLWPSAHAQMIAKLESVQGVVSIQKRIGHASVAAAGTELSAGDMISTMKNSTALLVFTDQSQIAMRPESRLTVPEYAFRQTEPQADGMVVNLVKGGMRTLTGLIGKRGNEDAYKVASAGTTVGVRGVDFIARVCTNDCGPEQRSPQAKPAAAQSAAGGVGKIGAVHGAVSATLAGTTRPLELNKAVFEGDVLESADAASALVVFADTTQFLLKPRTKATITAYNFDRERVDQNKLTVHMSSGGGQMTTGTIGKLHPAGVQVVAPQAVIGVRGTRFDFACAPVGAHEGGGGGTTVCTGSFYVHVSEGKVGLNAGNQLQEYSAGQTAYVPRAGEPPVRLSTVPRVVTPVSISRGQTPATAAATQAQASTDAPATTSTTTTTGTSTTGTSGTTTTTTPTQGLVISSNDGNVVLTLAGEQTLVPRGEAGLVGSNTTVPVIKLPVAPPAVDTDPFLSRVKFLDPSCFQ